MIIHAPQVARIGAEIQISSRIELDGVTGKAPETLWFRFPAEFEAELSADVDPFVVALLLLAMQRREAIDVRGPMSERLWEGLQAHQSIFNDWFPGRFHQIEIRAMEGFRPASVGAPPQGRACAFSGGVDSFYTFLKLHRSPNESLTHGLFMAGFDMPLHLGTSISELVRSYQEMMRSQGVKMVCGSTNVRAFVNPVDWTNAHGQALAASALFFRKSWSFFYIPSSYTAGAYPKWGTHPELDRLFSTETLSFVHHGAEANRVKKLELVSQFEPSFGRLRVCWIQDIGLRNCGECEKCIRTEIALSLVGRLERYRNFVDPLSGNRIRNQRLRTPQSRIFALELIREALARGKWAIVGDLLWALARRNVFYARHRGVQFMRRFSFRAPRC